MSPSSSAVEGRRRIATLTLVIGWLVAAAAVASAQTVIEPFPGVSGSAGVVYASTISNGKLYIGGQFSEIGYPIGYAGPFDLTTSLRQQPDFPKIFSTLGGTGSVNAVAPDGSGGWYIGGSFNHVGSTTRVNLVHVNADNSVASWNPAPDGSVVAIVVAGPIVYVAGAFSNIGGQPRSFLAAIDASTGLATSWNPAPSGWQTGFVSSLAAAGGIVYIGGYFNSILGDFRLHVAAIDASTGALTAWNPGFAGDRVSAIITDGAAVYYAGAVGMINPLGMVQAADVAGASQWTVSANQPADALTKLGATLYVGGLFSTLGGQPRSNIAAVAAASGAVQAWNPSADGTVSALASSGTTVYAGGAFVTIGGSPRRRAAALDATSGVATAWDPDLNGSALALALEPGDIFIGGSYTMAKTTPRTNAAAIELATGAIAGWDPRPNGPVYALASSGGVIYMGGGFTGFLNGGLVRHRIAAVDGVTAAPTAWNPNSNDLVWALAPSPPVVYVGGVFTTMKGQTRNHIAAVDISAGTPTSWDPDADKNVFGLAVDGSAVYARGLFTEIGGYLRNGFAALDPASGLATWDPAVNGQVSAIEATNSGVVYLSGSFTSAGGQPRNHLAALDAFTGLATSWDPEPASYGGILVADGSFLYAAMGSVGGQETGYLGAVDRVTASPEPWYPGPNSSVNALSVDGGVVYAVGQFGVVGNSLRPGVAALTAVPPPVGVAPGTDGVGVSLEQSRPNPCSGRADLRFRLDHPERVTLEVFDLSGRRVLTPIAGSVYPAGAHDVPIVLPSSSVGVFWYRLHAGRFEATKKLLVVR